MYFGSVKFFKDLIYSTAICIILFAALFSMIFGIKASSGSAETAELPEQLPDSAVAAMSDAADKGVINIPDGLSVSEVYRAIAEKGYTSKEIIDCIAANDDSYLTQLIEEEAEKLYAENIKAAAAADENSDPI